MKRLPLLFVALLCAAPVAAQQPTSVLSVPRLAQRATPDRAVGVGNVAPSMGNITPQMWLYMQELQRHDDPELAVRRNAEQRAECRQNRIEARKWFGLSNARPTASPVPVMGTYSPFWAGNSSDPQRWNGVAGAPVIQIYTEDDGILR